MKISTIIHIGILAFLQSFAFAQPQEKESPNVWAQAEAKMEDHLKSLGPKMLSVELKSERLKKYLPEFRVFVRFDRDKIEQSSLFLVNQAAEIADFGDDDWDHEASAKYGRFPRLTDFLRAREIPVKTLEDAIGFTRFFEELQAAPDHVRTLRMDMKNFAAFDKQTMEMVHPRDADWEYTSVKREGGWKVMIRFVGDSSVSIIMPPSYELDADEKGGFRDLRRYDSELLPQLQNVEPDAR